MDFSDKLAHYLSRAGLSQAELARRTHDHDPNINAVLKRKRPPQPERIATWSAALGLSADETAEFQALAEAAYLQRKLDKEGAGRIVHVAKLSDGQYAINAIAGTGRDMAILLPGTHVPPLADTLTSTPIDPVAALQRLAALSEAHHKLQSAADEIASEITALRAAILGGPTTPTAPVGASYKAARPLFRPDQAPAPATTR